MWIKRGGRVERVLSGPRLPGGSLVPNDTLIRALVVTIPQEDLISVKVGPTRRRNLLIISKPDDNSGLARRSPRPSGEGAPERGAGAPILGMRP